MSICATGDCIKRYLRQLWMTQRTINHMAKLIVEKWKDKHNAKVVQSICIKAKWRNGSLCAQCDRKCKSVSCFFFSFSLTRVTRLTQPYNLFSSVVHTITKEWPGCENWWLRNSLARCTHCGSFDQATGRESFRNTSILTLDSRRFVCVVKSESTTLK